MDQQQISLENNLQKKKDLIYETQSMISVLQSQSTILGASVLQISNAFKIMGGTLNKLYESEGKLRYEKSVRQITDIFDSLQQIHEQLKEKYAMLPRHLIGWYQGVEQIKTIDKTNGPQKKKFDHYALKLEKLRSAKNQKILSQQVLSKKEQARLERNEVKYQKSKDSYLKTQENQASLIQQILNDKYKYINPFSSELVTIAEEFYERSSLKIQKISSVVLFQEETSSHDEQKQQDSRQFRNQKSIKVEEDYDLKNQQISSYKQKKESQDAEDRENKERYSNFMKEHNDWKSGNSGSSSNQIQNDLAVGQYEQKRSQIKQQQQQNSQIQQNQNQQEQQQDNQPKHGRKAYLKYLNAGDDSDSPVNNSRQNKYQQQNNSRNYNPDGRISWMNNAQAPQQQNQYSSNKYDQQSYIQDEIQRQQQPQNYNKQSSYQNQNQSNYYEQQQQLEEKKRIEDELRQLKQQQQEQQRKIELQQQTMLQQQQQQQSSSYQQQNNSNWDTDWGFSNNNNNYNNNNNNNMNNILDQLDSLDFSQIQPQSNNNNQSQWNQYQQQQSQNRQNFSSNNPFL